VGRFSSFDSQTLHKLKFQKKILEKFPFLHSVIFFTWEIYVLKEVFYKCIEGGVGLSSPPIPPIPPTHPIIPACKYQIYPKPLSTYGLVPLRVDPAGLLQRSSKRVEEAFSGGNVRIVHYSCYGEKASGLSGHAAREVSCESGCEWATSRAVGRHCF
jgi:hypothetical protein